MAAQVVKMELSRAAAENAEEAASEIEAAKQEIKAMAASIEVCDENKANQRQKLARALEKLLLNVSDLEQTKAGHER